MRDEQILTVLQTQGLNVQTLAEALKLADDPITALILEACDSADTPCDAYNNLSYSIDSLIEARAAVDEMD